MCSLLVNIIAFDQERINGAKAESTLIHQRFYSFAFSRGDFPHMLKNRPSMLFCGQKVGPKTNNSCVGQNFLSNENEFPAPGVDSCWLRAVVVGVRQ